MISLNDPEKGLGAAAYLDKYAGYVAVQWILETKGHVSVDVGCLESSSPIAYQ